MLEGTLYSILFRMVAAGYLSEYEMLVGKKRKRVTITSRNQVRFTSSSSSRNLT